MKKLPLSKGAVALVDDQDFAYLNRWKWSLSGFGYAARHQRIRGRRPLVYMHRALAGAAKGQLVDHINQNRLDNRRKNLRVCTRSQNQMNRGKQVNNTSGFKGVSWYSRDKTWEAFIKLRGKKRLIGRFKSKTAAVRARRAAAVKFHGEFACS